MFPAYEQALLHFSFDGFSLHASNCRIGCLCADSRSAYAGSDYICKTAIHFATTQIHFAARQIHFAVRQLHFTATQIRTHIEIFIHPDSSVCSKQCNSKKMKFYVRVHELSITSYPQFNYVHFDQDNKTTHT